MDLPETSTVLKRSVSKRKPHFRPPALMTTNTNNCDYTLDYNLAAPKNDQRQLKINTCKTKASSRQSVGSASSLKCCGGRQFGNSQVRNHLKGSRNSLTKKHKTTSKNKLLSSKNAEDKVHDDYIYDYDRQDSVSLERHIKPIINKETCADLDVTIKICNGTKIYNLRKNNKDKRKPLSQTPIIKMRTNSIDEMRIRSPKRDFKSLNSTQINSEQHLKTLQRAISAQLALKRRSHANRSATERQKREILVSPEKKMNRLAQLSLKRNQPRDSPPMMRQNTARLNIQTENVYELQVSGNRQIKEGGRVPARILVPNV